MAGGRIAALEERAADAEAQRLPKWRAAHGLDFAILPKRQRLFGQKADTEIERSFVKL